MMKFVLASASPRRQALLEMLGLKDLSVSPRGERRPSFPGLPPTGGVKRLREPGEEVAARLGEGGICAYSRDTVSFWTARIG